MPRGILARAIALRYEVCLADTRKTETPEKADHIQTDMCFRRESPLDAMVEALSEVQGVAGVVVTVVVTKGEND